MASVTISGSSVQPAKHSVSSGMPKIVIIYLISGLTPFYVSAGSLLLTPLRIVLILLFVPMMIQLLRGRLGKIFIVDILFVLHFIWMVITLYLNNPDRMVEFAGSTGLEFLGGYLVARLYIRGRSEFIHLIKFLGVVLVLLFPFTFIEAETGKNLILDTLQKVPGIRPYSYGYAEPRLGFERAQGVLMHPIHFGMFCAIPFALTVEGLKGRISDFRRIATGLIIAFSAFLSLSSGAFLALVLQVFLLIYAAIMRPGTTRWWILVGLCVLMYVVVDMISNRTPFQVFFSYATFSPHTAYWRAIIFEWGMKSVWANPIIGIGLNEWVRPWFMFSGSMDNFFLVIAVRYGIPGFLLLAAGYLYILGKVAAHDFSADTEMTNLRRAWIITFVGLTFSLTTVHIWNSIYSLVFFLLGSGVWMIAAKPESTDETVADGAETAKPGYSRVRYARASESIPEAPAAPASPAVSEEESALRYSRFEAKPSGHSTRVRK